jgi:hypothetical protein
MLYIVFVEYAVDKQAMDEVAQALCMLREEMKGQMPIVSYHGGESCDQPGLIVEMIQVPSWEQANLVKRMRTALEHGWGHAMDPWIKGGRGKVRSWIFRLFDDRSLSASPRQDV